MCFSALAATLPQFDYTLEILAAFIGNLTAPVLSCNLNVRSPAHPCTPLPTGLAVHSCIAHTWARAHLLASPGAAACNSMPAGAAAPPPQAPWLLCPICLPGRPLCSHRMQVTGTPLEGLVKPYTVKTLPVSGAKVRQLVYKRCPGTGHSSLDAQGTVL